MKDVNSSNFGLLIAYLVPGFITLTGLARISPTVNGWLTSGANEVSTVSGFLFGTLAAVAAGLVINAIRWHTVDPLHYASGVPRKSWDYSRLPEQILAFQYLVSNQFRYYECYANTMVAIAFSSAVWFATTDPVDPAMVAAFFTIQFILWSASRRTLLNYHRRIGAFLSEQDSESQPLAETIDQSVPSWYTQRVAIRRYRKIIFPFVIRRIKRPRWAPIDTINRRASVK